MQTIDENRAHCMSYSELSKRRSNENGERARERYRRRKKGTEKTETHTKIQKRQKEIVIFIYHKRK